MGIRTYSIDVTAGSAALLLEVLSKSLMSMDDAAELLPVRGQLNAAKVAFALPDPVPAAAPTPEPSPTPGPPLPDPSLPG